MHKTCQRPLAGISQSPSAARRPSPWLAASTFILASCLFSGCGKHEFGRVGSDHQAPAPSTPTSQAVDAAEDDPVIRFATFNVALNRRQAGALADELESGDSQQAQHLAEIIQRVRPDVLLLNEIDYDVDHRAANVFHDKYLGVGQGDQPAIQYAYRLTAEVNTGEPMGFDLNRDGKDDGPADAYGFGDFHGQYGMAVFSKHPIDRSRLRTFRKFLWKDMPDALWPLDPATQQPYYNDEIRSVFRLSSKSHWDVPIQLEKRIVHFLVCHPTPPVFDGPEDRNGRRNHDEIRFWADYIDEKRSRYIRDDQGHSGGLPAESLVTVHG